MVSQTSSNVVMSAIKATLAECFDDVAFSLAYDAAVDV